MNQPESLATLAASVAAPDYVKHPRLLGWVREIAALTKPARIVWCDGSDEEYQRLCDEMVASGMFKRLDPAKRPNSFLACSDPSDVARVEDRRSSAASGRTTPANNWRAPHEMRATLDGCLTARCAGARCTSPFRWGRSHRVIGAEIPTVPTSSSTCGS
jgi:phosphoenolpyruvate carboxykinase (GTP)